MSSIAGLQALIDTLTEQIDVVDTVAELYLPPVTYNSEVLNITTPSLSLYGSTEGEGRTVFTNTVHVPDGPSTSVMLYDLDFG